ncbi:37 kDa salivary gland allergen Aed a 2-like [Topomyia yanbarensis]|uniref:37 kDa salivary gland allergen Aed a 2-like n=1 Tax=Topomyia yanbarensis TaxID=2498891 RepID=UPI00273C9D4A|nr:37 kDa salivary gland allergen Aed a 2-like [Topomyia yanbarensis]
MAAGHLALIGLLLALASAPVWSAAVPCESDSGTGNDNSVTEWQPRTPEQTLYAYVRCLNDSSASVEMKIRWVRWQPDNSPESQCYVKCVSEELRLFDTEEQRFRPERFVQQADAFYKADPAKLQALKVDAEPMLTGKLEEVSCQSVFEKYAKFYATHTDTILRMFHGHYQDIGHTYQRLGDQVKQIGQTFVEYCEKRYGSRWTEDSSCPSAALLDCILRGFRWITETNELNINEVRRDYGSAGYNDEADLCESSTANARAFYLCLRDKGAEKLDKVIKERNQRTAFYFDVASQEEPWKSAVEFANNLV